MKLKKIGIDIDGVLADFSSKMRESLKNKFGISVLTSDFHKHDKEINSILDNDPELAYSNLPVYENAVNAIKQWRSEGMEIFLITKRGNPKSGETKLIESVKGITKEWLKLNNVEYDRLIFANDKTIPINMYGVQVFIEDNLGNSFKIAKDACPVILVNRTWNQKEDLSDKIIRVEDWLEINDFVNYLEEGSIKWHI